MAEEFAGFDPGAISNGCQSCIFKFSGKNLKTARKAARIFSRLGHQTT
jgi:hypothetical protein